MREKIARLVALITVLLICVTVLIFAWQQKGRMADMARYIDPQDWAALYPLHVASFMRGAEDTAGEPFDRLAANPFRQRAWAGHPFELDYIKARAHYFAQIDQQQSRRTLDWDQPAACIHCHAAEAPQLVEQFGWDGLNAMRYDEVRDMLHHGSSCTDCHQADTMDLRISRPALTDALAAQGIDVTQASRHEMRTYVCAQCHVEYYFERPGNSLSFPLASGLSVEAIEQHFDERRFSDWTHRDTGAGLIKVQHPNFELHSLSVHAAENTSCADCHMPAIQEGGMRITDHWMRSPLTHIEASCLGCHDAPPERLAARSQRIQSNTDALLATTESVLTELMDSIVEAMQTSNDEALEDARRAHRQAQLRWDFIDADASRGFHASREATRMLTEAVDIAREGIRSLDPSAAVQQADQ